MHTMTTVCLPLSPLPPSSRPPQLCVLGDHKHCEEAKALGLDAMTVDDLKKLNKNKKLVKKLGECRRGRRRWRGQERAKPCARESFVLAWWLVCLDCDCQAMLPAAFHLMDVLALAAAWHCSTSSRAVAHSPPPLPHVCPHLCSQEVRRLHGLRLGDQADPPSVGPRPQQGRQVPHPHHPQRLAGEQGAGSVPVS